MPFYGGLATADGGSTGYSRRAAAFMANFECNGEPHFLLTRRTNEVCTHNGQISFSGGMQLHGESLQQTALREIFEEVGIEEDSIEILGRFHGCLSANGDAAALFVSFINGIFVVVPQKSGVAEVLSVSLGIFADPSRLRIEKLFHSGSTIDAYYYHCESHEIWGLTAHIIKDFLAVLAQEGS